MADQLERLTNLLAVLLETKVPLTLERVHNQMPGQYPEDLVARRGAFERDKSLLRSQGIPLEQQMMPDGSTGYRIDRRAYELGDLGLTESERRALQLAVAAVRLGVDWGDDALLKLGTDETTDGTDVVAALPSLPALAPLFEAHMSRATVEFAYHGKPRRLDPWGLLAREGFWYVVGLEHSAAAERTFRVDRIEGEVTIGDPTGFDVPIGYDPAKAISTDIKGLGASHGTEASVWVDAVRARRVESELGEERVTDRRVDGSLVVVVPCANLQAFRNWVLGLGDHAEVLGPPAARADLVAWLEQLVGAS